jgi:hypothetical protein
MRYGTNRNVIISKNFCLKYFSVSSSRTNVLKKMYCCIDHLIKRLKTLYISHRFICFFRVILNMNRDIFALAAPTGTCNGDNTLALRCLQEEL